MQWFAHSISRRLSFGASKYCTEMSKNFICSAKLKNCSLHNSKFLSNIESHFQMRYWMVAEDMEWISDLFCPTPSKKNFRTSETRKQCSNWLFCHVTHSFPKVMLNTLMERDGKRAASVVDSRELSFISQGTLRSKTAGDQKTLQRCIYYCFVWADMSVTNRILAIKAKKRCCCYSVGQMCALSVQCITKRWSWGCSTCYKKCWRHFEAVLLV